MKLNRLAFIAGGLMLVGVACAEGTIYWYNGDFDGTNGFANDFDAFTYDDFNVGAGGVHLNGVFANCLTNATITNMNWEIRQGISEGNGGTLVASGSGSVTMTATGRNGFGFDEFNLLVKGLDVSLDEGTYFLGTNVGDLGGARSFVSTTVGTNSVGSPGGNNGNTFLNSTFFGANFTDWQNLVGPGTWDVSYGVQTDSVPEPATFVAIGLGLAALVARRRK